MSPSSQQNASPENEMSIECDPSGVAAADPTAPVGCDVVFGQPNTRRRSLALDRTLEELPSPGRSCRLGTGRVMFRCACNSKGNGDVRDSAVVGDLKAGALRRVEQVAARKRNPSGLAGTGPDDELLRDGIHAAVAPPDQETSSGGVTNANLSSFAGSNQEACLCEQPARKSEIPAGSGCKRSDDLFVV